MVDKVIVTLIYSSREFDVEVPAEIKIGQIKPVIARALSYKGMQLPEDFQLVGNGRRLENTDTLSKRGIWDGSYLEVI